MTGLVAVALASTAAAAEAPQNPDADVECLVDLARTKGQLEQADRARADLAIMYYLGRLTARLSEVELAQRIERLSRPSTEDQAKAIRRRCAAEMMTSALFMAPINKALAQAAK
jgi:hypothetical protein